MRNGPSSPCFAPVQNRSGQVCIRCGEEEVTNKASRSRCVGRAFVSFDVKAASPLTLHASAAPWRAILGRGRWMRARARVTFCLKTSLTSLLRGREAAWFMNLHYLHFLSWQLLLVCGVRINFTFFNNHARLARLTNANARAQKCHGELNRLTLLS